MPNFEPKPEGISYAAWLRSKDVGIRVLTPIRRELGTKAPSQLVESTIPGGLPSYFYSEGALEQEEIDYMALVQDERERDRKKQEKTDSAKAISNLAKATAKAPKGKRFSTLQKIKKEGL